MNANDDIDLKSRRDRIDIAISCVSTIFLCTWVAFHPNIPGPYEPKWKVIRRRIGCMIGAILAPEIYVLLAARQFIAAQAIAKEHRGRGWTLTHGFFALMGGFATYDGKTASEIVFFDPILRSLSLNDAFGRDLTSLIFFEYKLASQHLSLGPARRLPFLHESEYRPRSFDALLYIHDNLSRFADSRRRVETEFNLSIDYCLGHVLGYFRQLENDNLDHIRSSYEDPNPLGERNCLKGILTFLEAFEHCTAASASGKSEDTDNTRSMENAGETTRRTSCHTPDRAIEDSRLRSPVPRINEQDIQDKSKSDMLTKTIALFQVAWFILQLCARYHGNLAITELEILTLAFCILNFATYALWWKKPFAVTRRYAIQWKDDDWEVIVPPPPPPPPPSPFPSPSPSLISVETSQYLQEQKDVGTNTPWWMRWRDGIQKAITSLLSRFREILLRRNKQFREWWGTIEFDIGNWRKIVGGAIKKGIKLVTVQIPQGETWVHWEDKRVSTFSPKMMRLKGRVGVIYYLSGCLLILVFGSIHFLAWSSGPTNTDKLVWRVCSICVAVLPVVVFLFEPLDVYLLRDSRKSTEFRDLRYLVKLDLDWEARILLVKMAIARLLFYILLSASVFYVIARIGLLVLVVRSLIHCPSSALEAVPWSQIIPHV